MFGFVFCATRLCLFPGVFAVALAGASSQGNPRLGKAKGEEVGFTVEPRGFRKDICDIGVNEFLNELLCVNLIRLSREKVTLPLQL